MFCFLLLINKYIYSESKYEKTHMYFLISNFSTRHRIKLKVFTIKNCNLVWYGMITQIFFLANMFNVVHFKNPKSVRAIIK